MAEGGLSYQDLVDAWRKMKDDDIKYAKAAAERAATWSSLKLAFSEMNMHEKFLIGLAMQGFIFHPEDGKQVLAIIEKYRRDSAD